MGEFWTILYLSLSAIFQDFKTFNLLAFFIDRRILYRIHYQATKGSSFQKTVFSEKDLKQSLLFFSTFQVMHF